MRLNTENVSGTVRYVENTWKKLVHNMPFEYSFLDGDYNNLYINEKQTRKLFTIFSSLAIFIACLGLFGLSSFTADQKTKEIGIRKVLGASVLRILTILNKNFIKWVIIANVIAWPAAYFIMHKWLQNFAYRTGIGLGTFILAAVLSLVITLLTVSFQTVRAALANPADSLRYE